MARIVLGMGTAHGPMISTPPEEWGQRVQADLKNPELWFRGNSYNFEELARLRADEGLGAQITPERWDERHATCGSALLRMAGVYDGIKPDVAVIVGNDQHEIFGDDNMPAFCVFAGETVDNVPATEEQKAMMPPGVAIAERGHRPPQPATYNCLPELGQHIIESLIADEFDVARSTAIPDGGNPWNTGIPHAYGFVYRQIMKDKVIPHVPVILNTFYPPNQPTAKRCYAFGRALARAINSWDEDVTVAVIASGGLSHFVIDEEFDRGVLAAMGDGDEAALTGVPENLFQSGTSETKNWIATAGAMAETGFKMEVVDYVPCYRSEAGTGTAHAFVHWS